MRDTDIVIVGQGFAGAATAILLARAGYRVVTVDPGPMCPPQFRAEQIVGEQVNVLARMGLLPTVVGDVAPIQSAAAWADGRFVKWVNVPHYGIDYPDMVDNLRAAIPPGVVQITGMVSSITNTDAHRTVVLDDGRMWTAAVVIVATGLHKRLMDRLGAVRTLVSDNHSLAIGFDVERSHPLDSVFVYHGDQHNKIDYLTLFPFKDGRTRANLFCYTGKESIAPHLDKTYGLHVLLPKLRLACGPVGIISRPVYRMNSLTVVDLPGQPGVVVIGDAYQTPCPSAGTGIGRLLSDVSAVVAFAHHWIRYGASVTDPEGKKYYDDPRRQAASDKALEAAKYMRDRRLGTSLRWKLHRLRVRAKVRVMG